MTRYSEYVGVSFEVEIHLKNVDIDLRNLILMLFPKI
jgi:hypothetical protein